MMAYHSNGGGGSGGGGGGGGYSGDERESRSDRGDDRPDSDLGDKPIYLLEHLATFTVNKETGIVYPADGMRRLLQLEKTTGIWSQKMQLCLDNQWVLIMDYETGNIIERFPASLIQDPTAFTSNDPMEIYNNILVFIVAGGSASRSEMHIFQSQSISAIHLVEDLKQLRNGKAVTQHRDTYQQQSHHKSSGVNQTTSAITREQFANNNSGGGGIVAGYHQHHHHQQHESDSELGGINDETSSTSSDKYERDVTVLNHCFDDIEKFIARLQHAAAASRELERRRRNRKSKKKDPGEGLLTLRTRPPHEKEFIDIFAKFKLSFNLLAKLKAHIHDPNAPELVHFLFTPLALIVEASSDTYYESHLPARVINPLLTREAINLLINCVTSKETELWRSLGDAWTIPRDQWKGHMGSYHPVFYDGWSPDYPVVDELEHPTTPTNIKRRIDTHPNFNNSNLSGIGDYDYEGSPIINEKYSHIDHHNTTTGPNVSGGGNLRDFSARSDISIDSIERNGGPSGNNIGLNGAGGHQSTIGGIIHHHHHHPTSLNNVNNNNNANNSIITTSQEQENIDLWIDDLQSRGAKIVQVTYPRTANNDKELTVVRGEYLEILDDSRKWWKARNSRGQVAHVPHTIVTPFSYNDNSDVFNNLLYTQNFNKPTGRHTDSVLDRYTQSGDTNQASSPGPVMPQPNSVDWVRNKHIDANKHQYSLQSMKRNSQQHIIEAMPTVPPPPPPPPPIIVPALSRSNTNTSFAGSTISSNDGQTDPSSLRKNEMQEELKYVLTLFREKRRNLDIIKTPEIFIQQTSKPKEVEKWLRAKGFSELVLKKLHELNGNELFALNRETLEDYCGHTEGKRLASQITIQRNVSGYKTARTSELQAILARARLKTDQETGINNP